MTEAAEQIALAGVPEVMRLWSVTSLTKMGLGTGEGLIKYGDRQIATAAIEKRTTLDAILRDDGPDEAIKWLMQKRYTKSDKAKIRGTAVHTAAEQIALGIEARVAPEYVPYVEQYRRWLDKFAPRYLLAECPVYNVSHRYAGTLDAIVEIDGRALIVDYKTTEYGPDEDRNRPPYPEAALQLVAYARAELVGVLSEQRYESNRRYYLFDPSAEHEPMPPVDGALSVVISPHDCFAVPVRIDDEVWRSFLYAKACARFQSETSRALFGAVLQV